MPGREGDDRIDEFGVPNPNIEYVASTQVSIVRDQQHLDG
jgi:hypothetical protein